MNIKKINRGNKGFKRTYLKKAYLKKAIIFLLLIMFFTFTIIVGCQSYQHDKVKLQLKWVHQAQFAGNYVAKELGFYREEGISDVELIPFNFDDESWPIEKVQTNQVDFAITGLSELIREKEKGTADDVIAIAVIYKKSPIVIYSLKEKGIIKPEDLIGKSVGIERGKDGKEINVGILFFSMLDKLGIEREKINDVTIEHGVKELLDGEIDVSTGYIINEPYEVIEQGKEVNTILVGDYGANLYNDIIITNKKTIEENPTLILKFLRATFKGWEYAFENEDEAVKIVLKYVADSTFDHQKYMLSSSVPLILDEGKLGLINRNEIVRAKKLLFEQGYIKKDLDINDLFDNSFMEEVSLDK